MPIVTKMPTHRSSVERFIVTPTPRNMKTVSTKSSARMASELATTVRVVARRNAFGGRPRVIAFEHRDRADRDAEHDALDDAVDDVVAEIDGRLHVAPERAGVDADQLHADEVGAEYAERREQRREQRHRHDAAHEARRDDARERIDRHHFHRRQLLGRLHQADFGGDGAARAARKQQTRDDRARVPARATARPGCRATRSRRSATARRSPAARAPCRRRGPTPE